MSASSLRPDANHIIVILPASSPVLEAGASELGRRLVEQVRGQRLQDLSLNAVELSDRNLYGAVVTSGYETYEGLGWYGAIVRAAPPAAG